MPKLLIIDDEPSLLYSLHSGLTAKDLDVLTAPTGTEGIRAVRDHKPDAVVLDVRLPDMTGLEAFDQIKALDPRVPVVILTAFAATDTAIQAVKRGAFDYLLKPVDLHHLRDVVARAVELRRMQSVPAVIDGDPVTPDADEIVGRSPAMQSVYKAIGMLAPQDVTVLITGESGTGKELIARAVYQHSGRADKPFLAINCAAIPETLLESELFGHERGAFTGADRQRVGKFEQANGGTLFLDEIGDMTPAAQAKFLRVLQKQQFDRIGGNVAVATDVRVIAATNQDLDGMVATGRFRRDLLYRLNGFVITLPPLRDRREDIPLLAEHVLRQCGRRLGKTLRAVAPDALDLLERHPWPGNIRELQNVIRFAAMKAVGDVVTPDCLPAACRGEGGPGAPGLRPDDLSHVRQLVRDLLATGSADIYRKILAEVDRVVVGEVLQHVGGNQVHASELLGISRNTLRSKIQSFDSPSSAPS
ncbi:sigma-54-dependent transcriptional regulator [Fimbriiglobus ruber]|uniref:DNA-binding transcriptional regulator NtrC n=1 Tax=Fimbriiglobus ruber TaxID=1908690 RepID=A0A225DTJ4_9BACT|nr:sigma-54 dependent transcriptional regulator [Fimbriiglobus ruber]OWK40499.1 Response regulator of zinc sigma-54-dependent two-component system [Fimbriiglobus ruber]